MGVVGEKIALNQREQSKVQTRAIMLRRVGGSQAKAIKAMAQHKRGKEVEWHVGVVVSF